MEVLGRCPLGLDTEGSDFLSRMSGGEKQRLVLARTLYSNPKIIILDEATSNLDSAIEREILDSLKNIGTGITIIQISHKIRTIPDTEKIIYLKEGHISAAGTFFEIYKTSQDFRKFADAATQELM
jgi:ABC-type bacteriocin/lantibiotic exporter with double-glycine peptidase domain